MTNLLEPNFFAFELIQGKKSFVFVGGSASEKNMWLKEIKGVKKGIQKRQYEAQYGSFYFYSHFS